MKKLITIITLLIALVSAGFSAGFSADFQTIFENKNGKVAINTEATNPLSTKEIAIAMFEQKKSVKNGESFFTTINEYSSYEGTEENIEFIEAAVELGSYSLFMCHYDNNCAVLFYIGNNNQLGVLVFDIE